VIRSHRGPDPGGRPAARPDGLTDDNLERECPRLPGPGYPDEAYTVGRCLNVIMREECEHRRYAVRDLAVLEADQDNPPAHYDTAR
jgi:hypothetical protein